MQQLKVPVLVIHGKDDPLVHVSGGEALANAVSGSKIHLFDNVGHQLPEGLFSEYIQLISDHIRASKQQ